MNTIVTDTSVTDAPSATIATTAATANPLLERHKDGQSAWLDYIRRTSITAGELKRLVDEDELAGLQKRKELDAMGIYEVIAIKDIPDAADTLRPSYDTKCAMAT
jgi:transaldolase/glucose-6-phosphate isomerase